MRPLLLALAGAGSVLLAAAGSAAGGSPAPVTLRADVAEWSIVPSTGVVRAGRVRIEVHNLGDAAHQVVLVRTGRFGAPLPLAGTRAVVAAAAPRVFVRAGGHASFTVSLAPGSYLLLDNLPWHYWKGTSAAFSVR